MLGIEPELAWSKTSNLSTMISLPSSAFCHWILYKPHWLSRSVLSTPWKASTEDYSVGLHVENILMSPSHAMGSRSSILVWADVHAPLNSYWHQRTYITQQSYIRDESLGVFELEEFMRVNPVIWSVPFFLTHQKATLPLSAIWCELTTYQSILPKIVIILDFILQRLACILVALATYLMCFFLW